MVGTLVVCLPSEHDGGEVHLSFKEKSRTYATGGPGSKFDMTALAWFGDVSHEVKVTLRLSPRANPITSSSQPRAARNRPHSSTPRSRSCSAS